MQHDNTYEWYPPLKKRKKKTLRKTAITKQ